MTPRLSPQARLITAAAYLEEWATAVRMDWSEFDGREARSQLRSIIEYMANDEDYDPLAGIVCRKGTVGPHWYGLPLSDEHECWV
jgi:hypothetical protein